MFEAILAELTAYDTIIIHRHSKPDGDALGSQLGLKHLLRENLSRRSFLPIMITICPAALFGSELLVPI